jgi:hypothetical protein
MSNSHVHPIMAGILEAFTAPAVAEETLAHDDVLDESELELAPVTDETLHEDRDRRSERDRLMHDCGMSERDFFR